MSTELLEFVVKIRLAYPNAGERANFEYRVVACTKAEANRAARRLAQQDGLGVGRRSFSTATVVPWETWPAVSP